MTLSVSLHEEGFKGQPMLLWRMGAWYFTGSLDPELFKQILSVLEQFPYRGDKESPYAAADFGLKIVRFDVDYPWVRPVPFLTLRFDEILSMGLTTVTETVNAKLREIS